MALTRNQMAPYFVQLREFERRLLRDAIAAGDGDVAAAASLLGVRPHYVYARAKLLGGVLDGEPKNEPPGHAADAWRVTGRGRKKPSKNGDNKQASDDA